MYTEACNGTCQKCTVLYIKVHCHNRLTVHFSSRTVSFPCFYFIFKSGRNAMGMQPYTKQEKMQWKCNSTRAKAKAPLKFKGTFTCTYYRCTLTQVGNSQQAGSYQYCNSSNLTVKDNTDWIRCAGVTL